MIRKAEGRLAEVTGTDVSIDPAEHYDGWAESYENDLLNEYGYSAHTIAVEAFAGMLANKVGTIIDVGCGTGLVGADLKARGYSAIDGIDVSKGMLTKAEASGVYRELIWHDVEKVSAIAAGAYDAVICVGSFGVGHLGPDAMPELVRMVRPGGPVVIFMNAEPFVNEKYTDHIERMESDGVWSVERIEDHNYMSSLDRPGKLIIARKPSKVTRARGSAMLAETAKSYLGVLISHFSGLAKSDPRLLPFIDVLSGVDTSRVQRGPFPRLDHPAMAFLDQALEAASGDPELAAAAVAAARSLDWSQLYGGGGMDPVLAEGMLVAQVAGSYGCFASDDVATGQFLLAPNIRYPLHTHASVEIYCCVSGTLHLQHGVDGEPFAISGGDYSITPRNRVHSLWTGDEPVLLLYAWVGEIVCPIWCWDLNADGVWQRSAWHRKPGEPWKIAHTEPVSNAMMTEAHTPEG